jgi:16S rRNA (cytidine1402-2'-O)-methyltransferase
MSQADQGPGKHPGGFTVLGLRAESQTLPKGLHVVATPIGNLADVTLRALSTLAAAETVLAEDTRVTKKLLMHYGITTPLERFDAHASLKLRDQLLARLAGGATIALVSDAGTPLVSDPGSDLVTAATERGIPVFAVPGASAVLAGLVVSGLVADRFYFEGFLPPRQPERRRRIRLLAEVDATLVFFEAPHRLVETLEDLVHILGARPAAVARELTKMFETVRRGSLPDLTAAFAADDHIRGEIVILVAPREQAEGDRDVDLDGQLQIAMATMSVKDAATVVASDLGLPRRAVYARAVQLAAGRRESGD